MVEEDSGTGASEPPSPPSEPPLDDEEGQHARRTRLENLIRETIRRGLEKGIEAGTGAINRTEALRELVTDVKVPREIVGLIFSQIDETKNALVRGVAREVRDFLEATDMAAELQKALTSLSFEIKTEIRFIPNDAGTGVRPEVKVKPAPKKRGRKRKGSEPPDDEPDA